MKALILCAGEGRRLRPLTQIMPKPLVPVGGVPMVVRQILQLREAGIRDIVLNVAYGAGIIEGYLKSGSQWGVRLSYSREGTSAQEALETLGGIVKAMPLLHDDDEAFLVVAGDIVTDYPYDRLIQRGRQLCKEGPLAHLVLVPNPVYHGSGDMTLLEDARVSHQNPTHTFSSLGVYHESLFSGLLPERAKLFPWLWQAVDQGNVTGEVYEGRWFNVGDFDEWYKVQHLYQG